MSAAALSPSPWPHRHNYSCQVFQRVAMGDYRGAAALVRPYRYTHPALRALLAAVLKNDQAAARKLWHLYAQKPTDSMTCSAVALMRARRQDWVGIAAMAERGHLRMGAVLAGLFGAHQAGAFAEAAAIGQATMRWSRNPSLGYTTACCWARVGDNDKAFAALVRAVELGWVDWSRAEQEADLTAVLAMPSFQAWRSELPVAS